MARGPAGAGGTGPHLHVRGAGQGRAPDGGLARGARGGARGSRGAAGQERLPVRGRVLRHPGGRGRGRSRGPGPGRPGIHVRARRLRAARRGARSGGQPHGAGGHGVARGHGRAGPRRSDRGPGTRGPDAVRRGAGRRRHVDPGPAHRSGPGLHCLHLGEHGTAQGRDAEPPEPGGQHPVHRHLPGAHRARPGARGAAVSLRVRQVAPEHARGRGRSGGGGQSLSLPAGGAGSASRRGSHRVCGCAQHLHHPAPPHAARDHGLSRASLRDPGRRGHGAGHHPPAPPRTSRPEDLHHVRRHRGFGPAGLPGTGRPAAEGGFDRQAHPQRGSLSGSGGRYAVRARRDRGAGGAGVQHHARVLERSRGDAPRAPGR